MRKLLLFSFVIFVITTNAQPVLTSANSNPIAGEGFKWISASNVSTPGNAGANQLWDFSTLVANLSISTYDTVINANNAPSSSSYPYANIAFYNPNHSTYSFYKKSSDSLTYYGIRGMSWTNNNTDPEKILSYPFSYDSTFSDNIYTNTNSAGTLGYSTESFTRLADGYGTLLLPTGTFSNVLRIKTTGYFYSNSNSYNYTTYYFYLPGIHQPILKLSESTSSSYFTEFLKMIVTGKSETNVSLNKIKLFPNPATNNITIETSLTASIEILNPQGQLLKYVKEVNNSININISTFAKGLYIIKLKTAEGMNINKFTKE